jgi:hypothetical protein
MVPSSPRPVKFASIPHIGRFAKICATDSYCCKTAWDNVCVGEVTSICQSKCN